MRYLDVIIAALIVMLGSGGAVICYQKINEQQAPAQMLFTDILHPGEGHYDLVSQNKCVGSFNLTMVHDDITVLNGTMLLRTAGLPDLQEITLSLAANFNPLGQLVDSTTRMIASRIEFIAETKGTNPLQVTVKSKGLGKELNFASKIPGPLNLRENADGQFRLEYYGSKLNAAFMHAPLHFVNHDLRFEIRPHGVVDCGEGKDRFDLRRLIHLAEKIQNFLPTGS
jgi:hypothetical protein